MKLTDEARVGLFTLVSVVLIVVVISFLGIFSFANIGYKIEVTFENAKGLKPGNIVRFAGVDIGNIKDIHIKDNRVVVDISVDKKYQIPDNSIFTIGADGLLGEKYVDVVPPKEPDGRYIKPGTVIVGTNPKGIDEFLDKSSDVLKKLENVLDSMNNIVGDKNLQESLKQTVVNMDKITGNIETITASMADIMLANQGQIDLMIKNLSATSTSLNSTMARLDSMLEKIDNNGQTGDNIAKIVGNIESISKRVDNMAKSLEKVTTDDKTATTIRDTIENANKASKKANDMLSRVQKIRVRPEASFGYSGKAENNYRVDLNARIDNGGRGFLVIGVSDLAERRKLNLQAGNTFGNFALRMGAIHGDAGLGIDYQPSRDFKLFADLYDPKEHKLGVGAEFRLSNDLYLMGQSLNVRNNASSNTYVGIKQYF